MFIFNHSNAATISGSELKERISKWLKTQGANIQVEILDNIKYPYCNEKDLLISDISGSHRLIRLIVLARINGVLLLEINKM